MKRRCAAAVLIATSLLLGPLGRSATAAPIPIRMTLTASCLSSGGLVTVLTLRNLGSNPVRIDPDFHMMLDVVGRRGREGRLIAFVFPAPGFDMIQPDATVRFLITLGDAEPGEEPIDLSGHRLLLELTVYFAGSDRPATKTFSLRPCEEGSPLSHEPMASA